jgi:hypothetical protein
MAFKGEGKMVLISLLLIFNLNFIHTTNNSGVQAAGEMANQLSNLLMQMNVGQNNQMLIYQNMQAIKEAKDELGSLGLDSNICNTKVNSNEEATKVKKVIKEIDNCFSTETVGYGTKKSCTLSSFPDVHACANPSLFSSDDNKADDWVTNLKNVYCIGVGQKVKNSYESLKEKLEDKETDEEITKCKGFFSNKEYFKSYKEYAVARVKKACNLCTQIKSLEKSLQASGLTGTQIAALVLQTGATLTPLLEKEEEEPLGPTCSEQCTEQGFTEGTTEWDLCLCASTDENGDPCLNKYACDEIRDQMSSCDGQIAQLKEVDATCGDEGCDTLLKICKCTEYNHIDGINKEWKNGKCVDVKTGLDNDNTYASNDTGSSASLPTDVEEVEEDGEESSSDADMGLASNATGAKANKKDKKKKDKKKKDKFKAEKHDINNYGSALSSRGSSYGGSNVSSKSLDLIDKKTGKAKDIASAKAEKSIFEMVEEIHSSKVKAGRFMSYSVNSFKKKKRAKKVKG